MASECEPLRRTDVRLDPEKLHGFVTVCIAHGDRFADVFWDTRIYLEHDGRITLEFLPDGGTLRFVMFDQNEWSPAETASDDAMRLFKRFRQVQAKSCVYDIFTGDQLDDHQLQARRRQHDEEGRRERDRDRRFAF